MKENKMEKLNKAIYGDPTMNKLGNDIRIMDFVSHPDLDVVYVVVGMYQSMKVKKNKIKVMDTYVLRSVTFNGDIVSIDKNYNTVSYNHGECDLLLISPIAKKKSCLTVEGYFEYDDVDGEFMKSVPVGIEVVNAFSTSKKERGDYDNDDLSKRVLALEACVRSIIDKLSTSNDHECCCECDECQEESGEYKSDWSDLSDESYIHSEDLADSDDECDDESEEADDESVIVSVPTKNGTLEFSTNSGLEFLSDCKNLSVADMYDKYGITKYQKYGIRDRLCEYFGFDKESFKGTRGGYHRE